MPNGGEGVCVEGGGELRWGRGEWGEAGGWGSRSEGGVLAWHAIGKLQQQWRRRGLSGVGSCCVPCQSAPMKHI